MASSRVRSAAVEVTVIVGSILLAFAVDAWWEGQRELDRVESDLAGLEVGLRELIDLLDEEEARLAEYRSRLDRLNALAPGEVAGVSDEEATVLLESISRPIVTSFNFDLLVALLETDDLRNISDEHLQRAIARWRSDVTGVRNRRDALLAVEQQAYSALNEISDVREHVLNPRGASAAKALGSVLGHNPAMAVAATKSVNWGILQVMYDRLRVSTVSLIEVVAER